MNEKDRRIHKFEILKKDDYSSNIVNYSFDCCFKFKFKFNIVSGCLTASVCHHSTVCVCLSLILFYLRLTKKKKKRGSIYRRRLLEIFFCCLIH